MARARWASSSGVWGLWYRRHSGCLGGDEVAVVVLVFVFKPLESGRVGVGGGEEVAAISLVQVYWNIVLLGL